MCLPLTYSKLGICHMSIEITSKTSYRSVLTIIDIPVQLPLLSIITQIFVISVEWTLNIMASYNDRTSLVYNVEFTYVSSKYGSCIIGCTAVFCFNENCASNAILSVDNDNLRQKTCGIYYFLLRLALRHYTPSFCKAHGRVFRVQVLPCYKY
jgi:hypothetical protein